MRLDQKEILSTLASIFQDKGLSEADAFTSAELLVQNSLDGIYSHGVNRFPRIISYLDKGYIKPGNKPTMVASFGALEKWDGQLGMGNTNAKLMMDRTITLAKQYGVGCVALRNTNHWMRGGAYGLQAADNGCIGI
jgi:3-dehydro-L-gulonate 2-dehydrogenase